MPFAKTSLMKIFTSRKMAVMALFGFSSGLPLALTAGTLQAWMVLEGVDIRTMGIVALIGIPYTFKFLWSPLMDRFVPPFLGRRRGWLLITQTGLLFAVGAMAYGSPIETSYNLAITAFVVALLSASQDIVADAYRTDILDEEERGIGVALFVTGYRFGMLVSGALALVLSEIIGWHNTYIAMALLMSVGIVTTLIAPEPETAKSPPRTMREAVINPLADFISRHKAVSILLLIVLYKLGDAYAGTLTTPFLIRGVGFSASEVGVINKGLGLIALIIGAMFGGTLMVRLGLYRSLLAFGVLQAVSNLSFMLLAMAGKNYSVMVFAVGFENLSGGMGTAAFVAFLMALCNKSFSATQYALFSALASIGRVLIAPSSGFIVEYLGWPQFFLVTAIAALPGLFMLMYLKKTILELDGEKS